jgi:Membrane-fusion protein
MTTLKVAAGLVAIILIVFLILFVFSTNLSRNDIRISNVDTGSIHLSVNASGQVIPVFEEVINSPIASRIVEVYKKSGDWVEEGTTILRLDLQSAETEYHKLLDEEQVRRLQLEQLRINTTSRLSEMELQLKISRMELDRKEVELRNERYLDSLGAGTADNVLQKELAYNVSQLKLKEDEQKFLNQQALSDADLKMKDLELAIFRKSLAETKRTLEDARIRSPRQGVLTFVNTEVGGQVGQGSRIAVLSDLSNFKIEGEIADAFGHRIAVGKQAMVKIGNDLQEGVVSEVTPLSRNGMISFIIQLDNTDHPRLRSGLRTDVYIMDTIKDDVMRIANGAYYSKRGDYELFVVNGNSLERRKVQLGDSNYDYVEVIDGLKPGDEVVVSDMSAYQGKEKIRLKN